MNSILLIVCTNHAAALRTCFCPLGPGPITQLTQSWWTFLPEGFRLTFPTLFVFLFFKFSIVHLHLFLSFVVSSPLFIPNVFRSVCVQFIHLCPNGLFCIHLNTSRIICCCAFQTCPNQAYRFAFQRDYGRRFRPVISSSYNATSSPAI